jgi:transcriptional/translational regulatory protein YebC/TACO1
VLTDDEGGIEVLCAPAGFAALKTALQAAGLKAETADIVMKPLTETLFQGDDAARMRKLLDALEGLDDVQEVYTNAIVDEVEP